MAIPMGIWKFQGQGLNPSHSCNLLHSNARSLAHSVRPGIKPVSSWLLVRFVSAEPLQELQEIFIGIEKQEFPSWHSRNEND